jgi:Spy/CpxP family protein refolding chaperone
MKSLRWMIVSTVVGVCAVSTPALAGPARASASAASAPSAGRGAAFEQHLHEARSRVLREKVGLTEDKARKVEAILDRYMPERKKVASAMREARQKLHALVTLNGDDQSTYRGALEQVRTQRKALMDLMDRAFAEVGKELTAKEQAKLFLALDELRGKMGGRGHGHGHGHGHGPGGDDDRDDD